MSAVPDIFRSLADPTRLRIVALLRAMELSVGELAQVLGQSQPRVSRHVKILVEAGLAERRKEGSWVFLSLGRPDRVQPLFALLDAWSEMDGEDPWAVADAARLAAVRADRAAAAERYFALHAKDWDELRSLHIAESDVEAAIARALGQGAIGRLVDIGTGTGRMLELFAASATSAVGVDRSPEMLRLARVKLAEAGLSAAELRQGDMYSLPLPSASAETVIIHQVLHYAQQPAAAVAVAARLLLSARRPDAMYYREEWPGLGDVRVTLRRYAPRVFVCGPASSVEAVASALIDLGHDPARIRTERFAPDHD